MLSFAKLCATLKNNRIESDLTVVEQLQRKPRKKSEASTGFEPMSSMTPVRCSTNWAMKPCWKQVRCEFNLYPLYEVNDMMGFLCITGFSCFTTAKITFISILHLQFICMIYIIYAHHEIYKIKERKRKTFNFFWSFLSAQWWCKILWSQWRTRYLKYNQFIWLHKVNGFIVGSVSVQLSLLADWVSNVPWPAHRSL